MLSRQANWKCISLHTLAPRTRSTSARIQFENFGVCFIRERGASRGREVFNRDLSFHFYDFPRILWRAWKDRHVYEGFQMVPPAPPSFSFHCVGHEGLIKVSGKGWWLNTVTRSNPGGNLSSRLTQTQPRGYRAEESWNSEVRKAKLQLKSTEPPRGRGRGRSWVWPCLAEQQRRLWRVHLNSDPLWWRWRWRGSGGGGGRCCVTTDRQHHMAEHRHAPEQIVGGWVIQTHLIPFSLPSNGFNYDSLDVTLIHRF